MAPRQSRGLYVVNPVLFSTTDTKYNNTLGSFERKTPGNIFGFRGEQALPPDGAGMALCILPILPILGHAPQQSGLSQGSFCTVAILSLDHGNRVTTIK